MSEQAATDSTTAAKQPGKGVLGTLFLVVFIDLVGFGMVIPLLPFYAKQYEPSKWTFGLFMATYSLCQFLFAPILGRLSDRVGRRPVMLVSLAGAALGYALLGFAGTLPLLFLSRVIAGSAGGNISTAQAVIADTTTPETRAKGMGIIGAAFGLGFILGPFFGGVLYGISPAFPGFAASVTSLVAFGMCWTLLPETRVVGVKDRTRRAPFDVRALAHALGHPHLGLCLVMFFLTIFGFSNFEATFAQLLNLRFKLEPKNIGLIFAGIGVVAAIVQGGLIGRLQKAFGEARLVAAGMVIGGLALGSLSYLPSLLSTGLVLMCLAFGTGIINPSLSSLTSSFAEPDEVGGVLGIYQGLGSLGRILGPFVGEVVFGIDYHWPYRVACIATLSAAAFAFTLLARLRGSAA